MPLFQRNSPNLIELSNEPLKTFKPILNAFWPPPINIKVGGNGGKRGPRFSNALSYTRVYKRFKSLKMESAGRRTSVVFV